MFVCTHVPCIHACKQSRLSLSMLPCSHGSLGAQIKLLRALHLESLARRHAQSTDAWICSCTQALPPAQGDKQALPSPQGDKQARHGHKHAGRAVHPLPFPTCAGLWVWTAEVTAERRQGLGAGGLAQSWAAVSGWARRPPQQGGSCVQCVRMCVGACMCQCAGVRVVCVSVRASVWDCVCVRVDVREAHKLEHVHTKPQTTWCLLFHGPWMPQNTGTKECACKQRGALGWMILDWPARHKQAEQVEEDNMGWTGSTCSNWAR